MRRTVALTFVVVLGLIVGCSSDKGKNVAAVPPVLDVAPLPSAEPTPAAPLAAAAPVVEPVAFATPTPLPPEPVAAKSVSTASSKSYTVRKGDTLFSIAKTQLGSGKDWQKIAAANPGLTPQKLRAGQQIAMP